MMLNISRRRFLHILEMFCKHLVSTSSQQQRHQEVELQHGVGRQDSLPMLQEWWPDPILSQNASGHTSFAGIGKNTALATWKVYDEITSAFIALSSMPTEDRLNSNVPACVHAVATVNATSHRHAVDSSLTYWWANSILHPYQCHNGCHSSKYLLIDSGHLENGSHLGFF